MRRMFAIAMVLALVLAACGGSEGGDPEGGGDEGADTGVTQADDTQPASGGDDEGDSDSGEDDGATDGSGPSTATVTIGNETYEFSSEGALVAQCLPDLFGIMAVQLPMADGGDGNVSIVALHEGTDPAELEQINSIQVTIGDVDWVADPEDVRILDKPELVGKSQVDSVQVNGSTVTGAATFVGSQSQFNADSDMATGTFEATCGEERTS